MNRDFKEFIESLNDNGVRYLVVGGYAVAVHGYPRYTKDMDIWVDMTADNAANILQALEQFGFGTLGVNASDFTIPDQMLQLGHPPGRIDILNTLPGVEFSDCFDSIVSSSLLLDGPGPATCVRVCPRTVEFLQREVADSNF